MIIIGELINATRKSVAEAIENQDRNFIQNLAREQVEAGADYIDVNAGGFVGKEPEYLQWLVEAVQEVVDVPCCIDSPDPEAIRAALEVHKGTAMINSISLETERVTDLVPIVAGTEHKVIALCMSDDGMPTTADQRIAIADELIGKLTHADIPLENIYVDPLVQPVSADTSFGMEFLLSVERIMAKHPGIHTVCGLSNISFGLPERKFINRIFVTLAIGRGLDSAIINPLNQEMMASITGAETLMGKDDYCMGYIKAFRSGALA